MARLVVLRFEDNNQAETLVEDWHDAKHGDAETEVRLLTPSQENDVECNIVGLFGVPTKFCNPHDGHLGNGKMGRVFQRGTKWGWWVCNKCKKPTEAWGTFLPAVLGNAVNLLSVFLEDKTQEESFAEQAHEKNEVTIVPIEGTNRGVKLYE